MKFHNRNHNHNSGTIHVLIKSLIEFVEFIFNESLNTFFGTSLMFYIRKVDLLSRSCASQLQLFTFVFISLGLNWNVSISYDHYYDRVSGDDSKHDIMEQEISHVSSRNQSIQKHSKSFNCQTRHESFRHFSRDPVDFTLVKNSIQFIQFYRNLDHFKWFQRKFFFFHAQDGAINNRRFNCRASLLFKFLKLRVTRNEFD